MNPDLWELQEADNHLTALTREKAKLDNGTVARLDRDVLAKAVEGQTDANHKLGGERTARELELKSAEEKLKKQQGRLMNATSAHEITALQRDIEALSHARGDLDEAILNLMEECDTGAAKLRGLQAQLAAASRKATEIEANFASETKRLDLALEMAKRHRATLQDKVTPSEKQLYEATAKSHHGVAIANIEKGNCSVCGTAILPGNLREAKTQEFPTCDGCGRLLYVPW